MVPVVSVVSVRFHMVPSITRVQVVWISSVWYIPRVSVDRREFLLCFQSFSSLGTEELNKLQQQVYMHEERGYDSSICILFFRFEITSQEPT